MSEWKCSCSSVLSPSGHACSQHQGPQGPCPTVLLEPYCDRLTWEALSAVVARSTEGTCISTQGTKERALGQHEDSWLAILGLPSSAGWLYTNHLPLLEPEHPICDCLPSSQDCGELVWGKAWGVWLLWGKKNRVCVTVWH